MPCNYGLAKPEERLFHYRVEPGSVDSLESASWFYMRIPLHDSRTVFIDIVSYVHSFHCPVRRVHECDEPVIPCRPPKPKPPKPKPPCPPVFDSDWQKPSEEPDRNDDGWNEPVLPGIGVCPPPEPVRDDWEESTNAPDLSLCRMYQNYSKYEVIGLYGYANYLTKHNLWKNIGQLYAVTATEDDPSGKTRNLIDSFIVYNPNPFPVVVNYLTFA